MVQVISSSASCEAINSLATMPLNGYLGALLFRWKVQLPNVGAGDEQFGGCRGVEHCYERVKQIGEGTYGQVCICADHLMRSLKVTRVTLVSEVPAIAAGVPCHRQQDQ